VNVDGGTDEWVAAGLPTESSVTAKASHAGVACCGGETAGACNTGGSAISIDNQIRIVHGLTILAGMALGLWVSPWWYWLVVLMGLGLIATGLTDLCGTRMFLKRMPWNK
jgi:Inner membrane protein YgaP-like, transmembrane domain